MFQNGGLTVSLFYGGDNEINVHWMALVMLDCNLLIMLDCDPGSKACNGSRFPSSACQGGACYNFLLFLTTIIIKNIIIIIIPIITLIIINQPLPVRCVQKISLSLLQSCEMSYLLHRANLSNQSLPHEKCVNRDKFDN